MPMVDGLQTARGPCIQDLDVSSGYRQCGHVDSHNEKIFLTRDIGGSQKIV